MVYDDELFIKSFVNGYCEELYESVDGNIEMSLIMKICVKHGLLDKKEFECIQNKLFTEKKNPC